MGRRSGVAVGMGPVLVGGALSQLKNVVDGVRDIGIFDGRVGRLVDPVKEQSVAKGVTALYH